VPDRLLTAALAGSAAASAAAAGPTETALAVPDPPPWHWVVRTDSLELYAAAGGRLSLVRGGGAVHHVKVALAADGLAADVSLLPEPDVDPGHLARVTVAGRVAITDEAVARFEATEPGSHSADRMLPERAVDDLLRAIADIQGVSVRLAPEPDGSESDSWSGVLHGREDTPRAWLRAGEALAAMVLAANQHGLAIAANPVDAADPDARPWLDGLAQPYLTLRVAPAR
jgi:hypothetical protein